MNFLCINSPALHIKENSNYINYIHYKIDIAADLKERRKRLHTLHTLHTSIALSLDIVSLVYEESF